VEPRVAMLSISNFGSVRHAEVQKVRAATELVKSRHPELRIDGEIQVDTALSLEQQKEHFPFCELDGAANVLVFPSLASGLIATKMAHQVGGVEMIGPLTLGFSKPANVLHLSSNVDHVVNVTAITVIECLDGTL
jgi:malate dehydrogenase (oxaloacetate-decarboxylating)(NADP+)